MKASEAREQIKRRYDPFVLNELHQAVCQGKFFILLEKDVLSTQLKNELLEQGYKIEKIIERNTFFCNASYIKVSW